MLTKIPKELTFRITIRQLLIVLMLVAAAVLFFESSKPSKASDEIIQIKMTSDLATQVKLYEHLLDRVGPVQAQDDLYHSGLPFTGQTHLLNHEAGEWLYKKYGAAGLSYCREYFLASCFHGFVLDVIGDGGMAKVAQVMDECRKKGPVVFSQCSHAVGHGFLASVDYKNLTGALKLCDQMVGRTSDFPEFPCYDGVFMENIWGVHNNGQPSPDRWVKDSDPSYPCDDPRIGKQYLLGCWSNQPALAFQEFKGDIKKVGELCDKVSDISLKNMCFNGLARQINPITRGNLDAVFGLCKLLPTQWNDNCITTNAMAYFGVGDREMPFSICARIEDSAKPECYRGLIGAIKYSNKDISNLCGKIKDQNWKDTCLQK